MKTLSNEILAPYTSLKVGGPAETLVIAESYDDAIKAFTTAKNPITVMGYGANCLISDKGIPGTTIMLHGGSVDVDGTILIADAGIWWDTVVQTAIQHGLWGIELMSEIPSSVGNAVIGNIAAYGQQTSDSLIWIDVFDSQAKDIKRLSKDEITFGYRESSLQKSPEIIVLQAAFQLSMSKTTELKYDTAIAIGEELGLDHNTLAHCRDIIIETRRRAGSIWHPNEPTQLHTAGSFFKNPLVSEEQARDLARFDETGATLERVINQSKIHGGSSQRASAAHVLLAAGFKRGQRWDKVELHPSHILKLATLDGATAQEVYEVSQEIISTVKAKLGINLEPEVKFIGDFE